LPAAEERGRNAFALLVTIERPPDAAMPSLFRFLVVIGLIGGLGYVAIFALANVPYKQREIVQTVPPDKFLKQPH
jgi:hypothetical protein